MESFSTTKKEQNMKLEKLTFQHIKTLREHGAKMSEVLKIHPKCYMGGPYMVFPIYFGEQFLIAFPKYKDAVRFRTMLWNYA